MLRLSWLVMGLALAWIGVSAAVVSAQDGPKSEGVATLSIAGMT